MNSPTLTTTTHPSGAIQVVHAVVHLNLFSGFSAAECIFFGCDDFPSLFLSRSLRFLVQKASARVMENPNEIQNRWQTGKYWRAIADRHCIAHPNALFGARQLYRTKDKEKRQQLCKSSSLPTFTRFFFLLQASLEIEGGHTNKKT